MRCVVCHMSSWRLFIENVCISQIMILEYEWTRQIVNVFYDMLAFKAFGIAFSIGSFQEVSLCCFFINWNYLLDLMKHTLLVSISHKIVENIDSNRRGNKVIEWIWVAFSQATIYWIQYSLCITQHMVDHLI